MASLRCDRRHVGTSSIPRTSAAFTRPWPAMICLTSSTKTGLQNPNFSMLLAICRISVFDLHGAILLATGAAESAVATNAAKKTDERLGRRRISRLFDGFSSRRLALNE